MKRTLVIGAISLLSSLPVISQQPDFAEVIQRSVDPGMIDNDLAYYNLSFTLVNTGPSKCSNKEIEAGITGFSNVAPCIAIEGVDPIKAEQLGNEYVDFFKTQELELSNVICDPREVSGINNVSELAILIERKTMESKIRKTNFFKTRGEQILGNRSYDILMDYVEKRIKPGMNQMEIDIEGMYRATNLDVPGIISQACAK